MVFIGHHTGANVTELELRTRGFPGGDDELVQHYRQLIGAAPAFASGLDPEWCRAVMFELVTAAASKPPPRRRRWAVHDLGHEQHAVHHRAPRAR